MGGGEVGCEEGNRKWRDCFWFEGDQRLFSVGFGRTRGFEKIQRKIQRGNLIFLSLTFALLERMYDSKICFNPSRLNKVNTKLCCMSLLDLCWRNESLHLRLDLYFSKTDIINNYIFINI